MNQGRIWCVVNPTVGLPLFLGSVAVMAFTVHFAVLNNTTWMSNYWSGVPMKAASLETDAAPAVASVPVVKPAVAIEVADVAPVLGTDTTSFVVKVKPKIKAPHPG
jgi:light-harvesting protein B-800-850 alpha chain